AELLDQLLHPAGRDTGEVGVGDHRHERLLRPAARLQQPVREVAALPQLRHRQLDRADLGVPVTLAVAVAAADPPPPAAAPARARTGANHPPGEVLPHPPQKTRARPLELLAQPARDVHPVLDPPCSSSLSVSTGPREDDAVVSQPPAPPPPLRARLRLT